MSINILVIEDEPDIRRNLEYNLGREGFKASSVGSLDEANEKLKSKKFDLILLDLMLPDGSGLDLCRELKQDKSLSSMPVIILTAKDDEVDKVVTHIKKQATFDYKKEISQSEEELTSTAGEDLISNNNDDLYGKAVDIVIKQQKVSTSYIQRYLQIGYNRAARIIDMMEADGIVSKANHVGKRDVL